MAGNIVSISSGANGLLYGELQGPLAALIEDEYKKYENGEFTLWQKVFKLFDLKTHSATIGSFGGVGQFEDVGENGEYPNTDFAPGFLKTLEAIEWKNQFSISQTMKEDGLDAVMKNNAQDLIGSYFRTKCAFFWGLLGAALNNTDYTTKKKNKVSIKTMDGVNLFSTSHKMAHAGGTLANAFSDAFSASALGKVAEHMQNMKDDNGEILGLTPDTIIIPNTEAAKADVFGVVGAYHDPGTPAGNKYNYQFGNWNVITVPWLTGYQPQSGYNWILMDSSYNERKFGAVDVERIPLNIRSEIASNDANVWKGRGRFGGAFVDFRAFAAGGLSFGTSA